MKMGKKREGNPTEAFSSKRPARNMSGNIIIIIVLVIVTAALIAWVYSMGVKATETQSVVMLKQNVYKNQQITEDMIQQYDMVKAEFDKYSIVDSNGTATRRIIMWDERGKILGAFAAYPLQANTLLEYRSLYSSRIDNSDTVLYSFPGKEIMPLDIGTGQLNTFKTFLEPGDRVIITANYTETETVKTVDMYGDEVEESQSFNKTEVIFNDLLVADILNSNGDSVLDIYADYNSRTVQQQAALDASTAFQDSVQPSTLLVALTPEEKLEYFQYKAKSGVSFTMSLPQRFE